MKKLITILLCIATLTVLVGYGQSENPIYDTVRCVMLVSDTLTKSFCNTFYLSGFSVREKRNTSEGVNDAGGMMCYPDPCFHDYWQHLYYLDADKKRLNQNIIVWQSK
jgi:hypothetical protein